MGSKYSSVSVSGYNSGAPADDGTQTASNLVKWSTHKTKLGDPLNTAIASINSALVSALDNSARSISANDSAVAGDNARTLEVTGTTTVTLMLAATAGAGYWLNIVNAGSNTVTVAPTATDTVDGVASSFTLPAGTARALIVNSVLTGYNTFASYNISKNHTVQGTLAVTGTTTLSSALTYGGVTLSNSVTGTGSMMLSASPTTTGTLTAAAINASGNVTVAGTTTLSSLTASRGVLTDASKNLISADAPLTNSLGADVALNNTGNYFDGPSVAQGTSGTWFVSGTVTVYDTAGSATFYAKLWDGTTVISSAIITAYGAVSLPMSISLSGYIASPAANLRISVRDITSTSGQIRFNATGNSKDSTISAVRVA